MSVFSVDTSAELHERFSQSLHFPKWHKIHSKGPSCKKSTPVWMRASRKREIMVVEDLSFQIYRIFFFMPFSSKENINEEPRHNCTFTCVNPDVFAKSTPFSEALFARRAHVRSVPWKAKTLRVKESRLSPPTPSASQLWSLWSGTLWPEINVTKQVTCVDAHVYLQVVRTLVVLPASGAKVLLYVWVTLGKRKWTFFA